MELPKQRHARLALSTIVAAALTMDRGLRLYETDRPQVFFQRSRAQNTVHIFVLARVPPNRAVSFNGGCDLREEKLAQESWFFDNRSKMASWSATKSSFTLAPSPAWTSAGMATTNDFTWSIAACQQVRLPTHVADFRRRQFSPIVAAQMCRSRMPV